MGIKWSLKAFDVNELVPMEENPRGASQSEVENVQASLDKFGLIDKPIVNRDGKVIGGHLRLSILKNKGVAKVECWVPNRQLNDDEVKELNIRLNANSGHFDSAKLAEFFEIEDLIDWGLDLDDINISDFEALEEDEDGRQDKDDNTYNPNEVFRYDLIFTSKDEYDDFAQCIREIRKRNSGADVAGIVLSIVKSHLR